MILIIIVLVLLLFFIMNYVKTREETFDQDKSDELKKVMDLYKINIVTKDPTKQDKLNNWIRNHLKKNLTKAEILSYLKSHDIEIYNPDMINLLDEMTTEIYSDELMHAYNTYHANAISNSNSNTE